MAFRIGFAPPARKHLSALRKRDQQIILDAIAKQLCHLPDRPTRKRKQLEKNVLAPWELRVGAFRVFYDVSRDEGLVLILALGHKTHNTLYIGGEEIEL